MQVFLFVRFADSDGVHLAMIDTVRKQKRRCKENVVITNPWEDVRLNVFGCSVDLYAANPAKLVVTIANSTGKVTVLDIHVRGGSEGYHIENNDDLVVVKNSRAIGNTNYGYYILDNKVEITGSPEISGNGVGVKIVGDNVVLRTNKVLSNAGVGIDVEGDDNVVRVALSKRTAVTA